MEFEEDFELRLEFESIEDRFSSGYLNLSDLLKINKFTASGFSSFGSQKKPDQSTPLTQMYSIGDEEDEDFLKTDSEKISLSKSDKNSVDDIEGFEISRDLDDLGDDVDSETEENLEDDDDEFDQDDMDDEEYFRRLENQA